MIRWNHFLFFWENGENFVVIIFLRKKNQTGLKSTPLGVFRQSNQQKNSTLSVSAQEPNALDLGQEGACTGKQATITVPWVPKQLPQSFHTHTGTFYRQRVSLSLHLP